MLVSSMPRGIGAGVMFVEGADMMGAASKMVVEITILFRAALGKSNRAAAHGGIGDAR